MKCTLPNLHIVHGPRICGGFFSLDFEHSMQSQRSPSGEPGDSQKYVASSAPMLFLRMKTAAYEPADPPERIWSGLPMLTLLLRDVCFPHEYNQCEAELRWSCLLICCRNTTPSACHKQTQSSSTGNGFSTIAGNNISFSLPKNVKITHLQNPWPKCSYNASGLGKIQGLCVTIWKFWLTATSVS